MEGYNAKQKWLLLVKGIIVGFGAIMPGISGGTLCVAFGMYKPLIEVFSKPREGLKKYWMILSLFIVGIAVGFIGLSGVAGWLMGKNSNAVTCAFIGFVMERRGTGRTKEIVVYRSYCRFYYNAGTACIS